MFKTKTSKKPVLTFKHFAHKNYSVFCSLKREVRIGCLTVMTLTAAHNASLASRTDSLQIVRQNMLEGALDEVVVSGRMPVTLAESANIVEILTREDIENARVETVNDLLKQCASIDVRQRGAFGVQTDIGIGGGTNEQVCILINGVSVNNPQTGHLTADFPVDIRDIERVEIFDGSSARTFGSQALYGAINIITKCANENDKSIHLQLGNYGTCGAGGNINVAHQNLKNHISASYLRSDGATNNSDFQRIKAFYQGCADYDMGDVEWQVGYNYQRYGANTFYSASYPNQWERNNRILTSVKTNNQIGTIHISPVLSWLRSYDHFQLIRNKHTGENFHRNDVFTTGLNMDFKWFLGKTALGGELRHEGIVSSNLGKPLSENQYISVEGHDSIFYTKRDNRTNISFFVEHLYQYKTLSISLGALFNRNTCIDEKFYVYPGIDVSYKPMPQLKFFASWNQSMRLPTFTDLYYKSPTQEGNIGLKAEETSTYKIGCDYHVKSLTMNIQGIYRKGDRMIDWVMYSAGDIFHSTQFRLDNYEFLASLKWDITKCFNCETFINNMSISYMHNYQKRFDDIYIYKSNYALEYLRNKLTIDLNHKIIDGLSATWYWTWQQRNGGYLVYDASPNTTYKHYSPYSLVNAKINWTKPQYTIYLSLDNLLNHKYYDFGNVPQARFTFMLGCSIKL